MTSVAQVQANRANAQKSTARLSSPKSGPRTPEGKAKVAQNAVTHGLLARAAVLQGEDWEEYTCYHEQLLEELGPEGVQETEVAERIVSLSWRLRRAGQYQNAVFEALYDRYAAEPAAGAAPPDAGAALASDPVLGRMLLADFSGDRVLERVQLYERRIESSLSRARAELRQLRRETRTAAAGGAVPFGPRRQESGGYGRMSPVAREASDPLLARENPLCQTNPIWAVSGGQVPCGSEAGNASGWGESGETKPMCDRMSRRKELAM